MKLGESWFLLFKELSSWLLSHYLCWCRRSWMENEREKIFSHVKKLPQAKPLLLELENVNER